MITKKTLLVCWFILYGVLSWGQDDVDVRIAVNDEVNPNTFVVIIANENYKYEQPVPFALNDGEMFRLYCEKTLGIPQKNIRFVGNATLNDMRIQLLWLEKVMKAYSGEANALVYYSGHGMPDDKEKTAYLLPVDGNSVLPSSGLSTVELYNQLGVLPSLSTIVLLDACFSGARRDGQMLASSRGVAIKAKETPVNGNMVVFSASHGDETAYQYQEKRHGLFTYFILKHLQQRGGQATLGALSDYVIQQVGRKSIVENDKSQTPTVMASKSAKNWRDWNFAEKAAKRYEIIEKEISSNQDNTLSSAPTQPVLNRNEKNEKRQEINGNSLHLFFRQITESQKRQLEIEDGVEVLDNTWGGLNESGITKGFIIQEINGNRIADVNDVFFIRENEDWSLQNELIIKGLYPTGKKGKFVIGKKYTVRVYEGDNSRQSRKKAEQIGDEIKKIWPNVPVYVHFYSPRWVCRVGNFWSKKDANEMINKLEKQGYVNLHVEKK